MNWLWAVLKFFLIIKMSFFAVMKAKKPFFPYSKYEIYPGHIVQNTNHPAKYTE